MPSTPKVYAAWRETSFTYISGGLYGDADPGTLVQVWNDGKLLVTVTVNSSGVWHTFAVLPNSFPDGIYHITAIGVDGDGNKSAPSPVFYFIADSTAPAAPTITLDDPGSRDMVPAHFSGQAEAGSTVTLSSGQVTIATAVADASGHWNASATLADGHYSIVATARDAARNTSPASSVLDFVRTTADDFGADPAHAGALSVGSTVSGAINYAGDDDWFKVSLEALTSYAFTLKAAAGASTLPSSGLRLWDPQASDGRGDFIYMNPKAVGTDLVMTTSIGRSGDYYVIVGGSTPGGYTVGAVATSHDDNYGDQAHAVPVAVGGTVSGNFDRSFDQDTFKVTLTAGITYLIELAPGVDLAGLSYVDLSVNDAANSERVFSYVDSSGALAASFTPRTSGEYFISAITRSDTNFGSYNLNVQAARDDFGASTSNSGKLAIGATVKGMIEVKNDRDWFGVELNAGTSYTFALDQGDNAAYGSFLVYDATGKQAAAFPRAFDHGHLLTWTPATSGTYFLEVSNMSAAVPYTLQARLGDVDDHGASPATAGNIIAGQGAAGRVEAPNDVDWFKVSLKADVAYTFSVQAQPEGLSSYVNGPELAMVDASGHVLVSGLHNNTATQLTFQPAAAGDYYLAVSDYNEVFSYTISSLINEQDRYRGDTGTTGVLSPGEVFRSSFDFFGDKDWVRVELQVGHTYQFELSDQSGTRTGSPILNLYDSGAASPVVWNYGVLGVATLSFKPSKSGTYYVEAYNGGLTGSYVLKEASDTVPFADTTPPYGYSVSGLAGAGIDPQTAKIKAYFNEPVTAGSGLIVLRLASGEVVETFDVATSTRLSFSATVGDLTIDPSHPLEYGTTYRVEFDASAIKDKAGLPLEKAWSSSFTTIVRGLNVTGGPGNDSYANTANNDVIDGGDGIDTVRYAGRAQDYSVSDEIGHTRQVFGPGNRDTLLNIERIVFTDRAIAYDTDGIGGQAYRLYQASFNRAPDAGGLGFWIAQMDKGLSLSAVAQLFIASDEFKTLFGASPTDDAFINALYNNVLHRTPDQGGHDFWAARLHDGAARADVLTSFSESAENQAALIGQISKGMYYFPYH